MKRSSLALFGAVFAGNVFAQTPPPGPGWELTWGIAVPISPLASVLIAISLAGATYAFARRKRGQSLIALCVAAIAGVFALSDASMAVGPNYLITTKSGATIISCSSYQPVSSDNRKLAADPSSFDVIVGTSVPEGVTLTTVRPINGFTATSPGQTVAPSAALLQCQAGTALTEDTYCTLPCPWLAG